MSTEQLLNYLRGLKSEEIQRIEVIPQAGADYDADSAAGIIRITLRRQRDNGLTGNLSFSTRQSRQIEGYNPSLSLNGHAGRWTFNASGWASVVPLHVTKTAEHTEYRAGGALLDASSEMRAATTAAADAPARSSTSPNGTASAPRPTSTSTATARPTARRPTSAKRSG